MRASAAAVRGAAALAGNALALRFAHGSKTAAASAARPGA